MPTEALCHNCGHAVFSGARFCQHCGSDVSQEQGQVATQQWATPRGTPTITALDHLRQDTLGEFEILAELGRGGMATVYLGHDIPLDRKVAIKLMSTVAMDEGLAERFRREARTAAALNHPHIIPVYAVRERSGLLYFVMKFIPGQSLDPILKRVGALSIPMAQAVLAQAAAALGYAHRRGVIHRDVKPANIMVDDEGWVVMTDFGIAKVATATGLTMTGVTVGTPAYMSPEQCAGKDVTGASDQYSLGVLAYEMITGQKPFAATTAMAMMYAHFNETPLPLRQLRPDCPPELEERVLRMLAKSPEDRWTSIEEIFGAPSLGHDDPTRHELVALALSSPNATIAGRLSTPTSPIPPARRSVSASATVPLPSPGSPLPVSATGIGAPPPTQYDSGARELRPRPVSPPGRTINWGLVAIVAALLVLAGSWFATRNRKQPAPAPAPQVATGDTTKPSAPAPAIDSAVTPVSADPQPQPTPPPAAPETPPAVTLASVRVTPRLTQLDLSQSARLSVQVVGSDGNPMRQHPAITWRTRPAGIVTVGRDGTIRAVGRGTGLVIASVGGKADTVAVEVPPPPLAPAPPAAVTPEVIPAAPAAVANVVLTGPTTPLKMGETATLTVSVRDARGDALTGRNVTWESSDPAIATVASGVVTGRAPGSATITATVERRSATLRVTVAVPPDPAADRARATTEIKATLAAFAAALTRRSVSQLKEAYPALPADEEARWSKMLTEKTLNRIQADFEPIEAPQIDQSSATQQVRLKLQQVFSGRPAYNSESDFTARFEQVGGKWQLVQLQPQ